jgi:hypothetical protein
MKNWKQNVFFGMVAIIALSFGFVGCKSDPDPEKVWQSKSVDIGANKTMTVKFMALPDVTPDWWAKLEGFLSGAGAEFTGLGDYIITVTPEGTGGFVAGPRGTKTATVSEAFLRENPVTVIGPSIAGIIPDFVA